MSQITVQFSGVVAVGPGRPQGKRAPYKQSGPFHAIFPGSSRRKCAHEDTRQVAGYIPVHWPVIMTDAEPDLVKGRPFDDYEGNLRVWYPLRERLVFAIDGKWKPGTLTYEHVDADPLPDNDVDLLADMRRIWKAKSRLPSDAVNMKKKPTKVPLAVAGQVFIPGGKVSSSLGSKTKRNHVVFEPSQARPRYECDLVSDAVITFEAKKTVEIQSVSLDTGKPLDSIIFPVKGDLKFHIANADPRDIRYEIQHGLFARGEKAGAEADVDFELFYALLAPRETRLPVPVDQLRGLIRDCYVAVTER